MEKFNASKTQLKSLLIMFIGSIVTGAVGIYFLVYDANHFCDDYIKISGYMFLFGGICFLFATVSFYFNTTFEVILNEDYICINKPGFNTAKSEIIKYSDIISVNCIEKTLPITSRTVTTISLNTKVGLKSIVNIENAGKCSNLIKEKISKEQE